jgi:hypothetical protein
MTIPTRNALLVLRTQLAQAQQRHTDAATALALATHEFAKARHDEAPDVAARKAEYHAAFAERQAANIAVGYAERAILSAIAEDPTPYQRHVPTSHEPIVALRDLVERTTGAPIA